MNNQAIKRNTVLIVDDEEMNLKVLSSILNETYDIRTASSGAGALEMVAEALPDLILLDVLMPGMDGYETLATLKKDEKTRRIPVIFITGLDSKEDEEKGLAMDAADYISKPFSVGIVRLRVKNQIQIVNQIRTIESLSLMDQLTGIPNRRNLDNRLAMEWARAYREKQPISLMMMDVDKFKVFNDTYGHLVGDVVLQLVAGSFEHALKRKSDFAARYGGEEFCVLLPNTEKDGAIEIAERIRCGVEQLVIPCGDGKTTSVTISIGVHTFIPQEGEEIAGMIAKADTALYEAKETGRNRVCAYDASHQNGKLKIENGKLEDENAQASEIVGARTARPRTANGRPYTEQPLTLDPSSLIPKIGQIDGINIEIGLSHFKGIENTFPETVEFLCSRIPVVTGEMETALSGGDIKAFSITVHSVKSMLSTVGAMGMSRLAAKLETAGKAGDMDFCKEKYPQLHDMLVKLHASLAAIFPPGPGVESPPAAPRRKIIHVDDVNYTLVSLNDRLKDYFEIYPAQSHKILFEILENIMPDLILLDVKMPGMDGYQIISKLKEDPRYAGIPVIFLTGMTDEEAIVKCKALGAADVIIKPVADADLIKRITEHIP